MDPFNIALIFVLAMFPLAVIARVTSAAGGHGGTDGDQGHRTGSGYEASFAG
jgi:hypothetical protein